MSKLAPKPRAAGRRPRKVNPRESAGTSRSQLNTLKPLANGSRESPMQTSLMDVEPTLSQA